MPIAEAAFHSPDGQAVPGLLVLFGPTLQVIVGPSASSLPPLEVLAGGNQTSAARGLEAVQGLVDTGAQESCIDADLARRLGLAVVDRIRISGSNGAHPHDVFAAQVLVPSLGIAQVGRFAGVHLAGGGQRHHVLLGRTFLQNVVMIYDGRRSQVTLASSAILGGTFFPPLVGATELPPQVPPTPTDPTDCGAQDAAG